jgi:hypothetical protein
MHDLADVRARLSWRYFFKGQHHHLLLLLVLVPGARALMGAVEPTTERAATYLIGIVVAHQIVVWLIFRAQICFGTLTRLLGSADLAVWSVIFFPFLVARVVGMVFIGRLDTGSLGGPRALHVSVGVALLLPALYTLWSVIMHFGLIRAVGADHFRDRYREMPMVTEGAFRFSSNAMYTFAFLALWGLALLWGSRAALALALFQHAYIWVHWYCTEQPDLAVLYSNASLAYLSSASHSARTAS